MSEEGHNYFFGSMPEMPWKKVTMKHTRLYKKWSKSLDTAVAGVDAEIAKFNSTYDQQPAFISQFTVITSENPQAGYCVVVLIEFPSEIAAHKWDKDH